MRFRTHRPRWSICAVALLVSSLATGLGCARSPWPDHPGVPVDLVRWMNVEAGEQFFAALLDRRRAKGLATPIVASRYQDDMRRFAERVQAGQISVPAAEHAVEDWGRVAYGREIETHLIDCTPGSALALPTTLVDAPFLSLAYGAAQFRPQASAANSCVIISVAVVGAEAVDAVKL